MSDEEICESWEDIIENGILDRRLEELKIKSASSSCVEKERILNGNQVFNSEIKLEDTTRTQYVIATPQVKILKRPTDAKGGLLGNDRSPSKQPMKSLEQREAEYAQARLRIMGSSKQETDENQLAIANSEEIRSVSEKSPVIRQPKGPDGSKGFFKER